jgi:hypothetical protein
VIKHFGDPAYEIALLPAVATTICMRLALSGMCLALFFAAIGAAQQPVAFPHNRHMKLGLSCVDCHTGADTRAEAGIPSVRQCMFCHAKLLKDRPEIQKVAGYAGKNVEIPWTRVYSFSNDAHVRFQHAPHARAGVACATCHGDMTKATVAEHTVTHTMGSCLSCHRQKGAPEDCSACHY